MLKYSQFLASGSPRCLTKEGPKQQLVNSTSCWPNYCRVPK